MTRKMPLGVILALIIFTLPVTVFSQQNDSMAVLTGNIPVPLPGDAVVKMPLAPAGYLIRLAGSDALPVIDGKGHIHQPVTPVLVNLYYVLTNAHDSTQQYDISKPVRVPGTYENKGINPPPFVIPAVREWHGGTGTLLLKPSSAIVINSADHPVLDSAALLLQQEIRDYCGLTLKVRQDTVPGTDNIFLTLHDKDTSLGPEGYYLTVENTIVISARQYQGLFWGTRTFLQILEQHKTDRAYPKGIIRDYPKYEVRGFVLDVGRKFFTLDFLRAYVKFMSYYKMNDFQIHLNDNGFKQFFNNNWDSTYAAFRLQSETYPNLTAKDGSYSKKDFIALQQLANRYAVKIIPEIDAPAHTLAITRAVPQIASSKYGRDHLDINNPATYTVMENILREYIAGDHPVFLGKAVHIGTDEYAKKEAESFRAYTDHFIKFVQQQHKEVRLWGALTWADGKTPVTSENVTLNCWYNGYADPVAMKRAGYKLLSTPDGSLYIVPAAGYYYDYLDLASLFNYWEPVQVGDVFFAPGDPAIRGGSFAVWNDAVGNGISEKDVHDRVFPAMQVLAEKMWSGSVDSLHYPSFAKNATAIGEGPLSNMRGKIANNDQPIDLDFHPHQKNIHLENAAYERAAGANAIRFSGNDSYATLPYTEIGYDYTVSFYINPSEGNTANAAIFTSPNATFKLLQASTGQLGFSRDGYDFNFNYILPVGVWTKVTVTGTNKGTCLYINGVLQDKLQDQWIQYNDKAQTRRRRVQTLFFPLQEAGHFKGSLRQLKIIGRALNGGEAASF